VNQSAAAPTCSFTLDPASLAVGASGGPGQFTVNTQAGCNWSPAPTLTWVTITGGGGTTTGTVTYTVQANSTTTARSGSVTAGGQSHTITQAAAPPPCTYTLEPALHDVPASAGEQRFTVNTQAGCAWSATTATAWLTITGGASGTGPGEVIYQVQANPATAARSGAIAVAGQTHTVNQAAAASGP
jgi:hypothetical protein